MYCLMLAIWYIARWCGNKKLPCTQISDDDLSRYFKRQWTGTLKWESFKQVCREPKFFLTPGYKPTEQLTNALPIPKVSSGNTEWRPVEGYYVEGKRHDDGCDVNDWWRGCEMNVICMSYVSQLLQSLVTHLSLLAHPIYVIPAGSFLPCLSASKHMSALLQRPFSSILHLSKMRNDSLYSR